MLKKKLQMFCENSWSNRKNFCKPIRVFDLNNKNKLFFLKIWNCKNIVHTFVRTKKQYYATIYNRRVPDFIGRNGATTC